jgi:hypothetical protein
MTDKISTITAKAKKSTPSTARSKDQSKQTKQLPVRTLCPIHHTYHPRRKVVAHIKAAILNNQQPSFTSTSKNRTGGDAGRSSLSNLDVSQEQADKEGASEVSIEMK